MRISDWSSDVCSSDLPAIARALARFPPDVLSDEALREKLARVAIASDFAIAVLARQPDLLARLAADDGAAPPTAPLLDADNQADWPALLRRYRAAGSARLVRRDGLAIGRASCRARGGPYV